MRIKRGQAKQAKHKKVLAYTKGFRLSYSKLYKRAKEALLHSGQYSFAHRRKRTGQFRQIWIKRINAALTQYELKYNKFINSLHTKQVELDRKVLAALALDYPQAFKAVVDLVK
jgi:large subunit ribosomal protein L20